MRFQLLTQSFTCASSTWHLQCEGRETCSLLSQVTSSPHPPLGPQTRQSSCIAHGLGAAGDLHGRDHHLPGAGATWGPTHLVYGPCGDWMLLYGRTSTHHRSKAAFDLINAKSDHENQCNHVPLPVTLLHSLQLAFLLAQHLLVSEQERFCLTSA